MPKSIDTDALYRATTDLFADRGYDLLTTQEVARRAGINEATIYRRFGTKAALVEAALAHRLAEAPFADLPATENVSADLLVMAEALRRTTTSYGGAVVTLLTETARHPELRPAMRPLQINLGRAIGVLEGHQRAGRLAAGDPWLQLVLLLSPFVTAGLWARSGVDAPVEPDPAAVVASFLHGNHG